MALNSNRRDENSTGGATLVLALASNQHPTGDFVEKPGSTAESTDERRFCWIRRIARLALAFCLCAPIQAYPQPRQFPAQARLGTLEIPAFPAARLDGNPVVLAPGVLIRNEQNAQVLPQQFAGARPVLYRLDFLGQIRDIWILDEREAARARAGGPMNEDKTAQ